MVLWLLLSASAQAVGESRCTLSAKEVRLNVQISDMASAEGNVTITIYPDDANQFLAKKGKIARQRVPTVMPVTTACFAVPAPGLYAIAVYHDANDDHDFNRSFIGMPKEGFGFSRNPKTALGLPDFSEVRFEAHAGNNPVEIKLNYR
jgi:uncharacterized protein (DUF2141 family)